MQGLGLPDLLVLVFMLFSFVFPLVAIIDVAKSDNKNKAMWIVFIFFTSVVGATIYWFTARVPKAKESN